MNIQFYMGKREGYTTQQTLFIAKFEHLKEFKVYSIFFFKTSNLEDNRANEWDIF